MKTKKLYWLVSAFFVPVIIYFFFIRWRTNSIYGDDLYIHTTLLGHSLPDQINALLASEKFRPVQIFFIHFQLDLLGNDLNAYYIYNVCFQALNTIVFAQLINIFLKSKYVSLLFSLTFGLSWFSFFNLEEVLLGGRESLALFSFLMALYFIVRVVTANEYSNLKKVMIVLSGVLFSNIAMYTHERYIVMLVFILILLFIAAPLRVLSPRQKLLLFAAGAISIATNIILKKFIYEVNFLMGTDNTHIKFSLASSFEFLMQAILSIFQINSGPEHLVGIPFSMLKFPDQVFPATLCLTLIIVFIVNFYKMWQAKASKADLKRLNAPVFLYLLILCGIFLAPAISTTRLEQRWLQASNLIFLLLFIIGVNNIFFKNIVKRNLFVFLFTVTYLGANYLYLIRGADNTYMVNGARISSKFKNAVKDSIIRPATRTLYIVEQQRNSSREGEIEWSIGEGRFFEFYQGKKKKVFFVDSIYQRFNDSTDTMFKNFDIKTSQFVYVMADKIVDLTKNFIQDTLKEINQETLARSVLLSAADEQYHQKKMLINQDNFDRFFTSGFHTREGSMRWTSGKASIEFPGGYIMDTGRSSIEIKVFMPPVCKDIVPAISITDMQKKRTEMSLLDKTENAFIYVVYMNRPDTIKKIDIVSDTINSYPDGRTLSFPFRSLAIQSGEAAFEE